LIAGAFMQKRINGQHFQDGSLHKPSQRPGDRPRHRVVHLVWLHSAWFGYVASLLLVGAVLLVERIDQFFPSAPIFIGAPFGLVSILVGLIWGLGPALFSIAIGVLVIVEFLSPGLMTPDVGRDTLIVGPFVFLQIVAVATVIRFEAARRRILADQQVIQAYARELEAANQRLVQVNEQLERANYLKDYVITRSSHELRTPVTTILGRTQLVLSRLNRSGETPENWSALRKHLEIVAVQAQRLRALIDDLFDLSSVRSGEVPLRLAPCDIGSLCREVIEDQQALSGRSIELELPAACLLLQADEKHLTQVLVNLVNNAVKYSPEHSTIHVCVRVEDAYVIFQVQNEGTVLSPTQLEQLFKPFYRTLDAETSPVKGWGLGLSISKEIVERHGGQIWAESSEERGITFFVRLPLQANV
jgi:signal transduction histidine kinase